MPKSKQILKNSKTKVMRNVITALCTTFLSFFTLQAIGQKAVIVSCRPMTVQIKGIGTTEYIFAEANYAGNIKLLLLPAESGAKNGDMITIFEEEGKPRQVEVRFKKWYCYLRDYLNQVKNN